MGCCNSTSRAKEPHRPQTAEQNPSSVHSSVKPPAPKAEESITRAAPSVSRTETNTRTEEAPKKPEGAKTNAKDIEGIVTINDAQIDLSQLSMTDMISNAKVLVDIVMYLIKSNLAKNQFLKAVFRRMQSLEPCFAELQKKNSTLTRQPTVNLIHIVNKIKSACERMMAEDKSFWERIKDVMTANSQLSELMDLNETLTKIQADLMIPLQLEEAKKIDKMFEYLQKVTEQGSQTYKSVENHSNVLPLAKKMLKNEEAFIFWFGRLFYSIFLYLD